MNKVYVGEFISQKIVESFDGPKSYVQVYKEVTKNGIKYVAITKDNQEYALMQVSNEDFSMLIGEDTYYVYPEDGDSLDL